MDAGPLRPRDPMPACSTDGSLKSIRVLGTPVACATYDSALERIKALAREPRATAVCPSNTHILGEARHNPEFAQVLARFDLVLPDGMPVVWALNFRGAGLEGPRIRSLFHATRVAEHTAAMAPFLFWRFRGMPRRAATRADPIAAGYRNCRHAQPAVSAFHGGRRGVVRRYHQSRRSGFRVGGVARRADGTVDHRQSGAVPEGCVPCGGRCIYAAQRPPLVRSAVDATDGVDLGLPVVQGAAPTGPALPAI